MKKSLLCVILFVILILNTKAAQGSVEDITIEEIKALDNSKEIQVTVKNLPRLIGFEIKVNGIELTENCRLRRGDDFLVDTLLVIKIPNKCINSSNTLFLRFYDSSSSKNFTENFVFTPSYPVKINWSLTCGIFVGLAVFNMFGYNRMSRKTSRFEEVLSSSAITIRDDNSGFFRKILVLIISVIMFSIIYSQPYFYFPQLTSYTWGFLYDIFHYFSVGCFYIALIGFSHHCIQFIFGVQRKVSKDPNVEYTSSIYYYYRKVRGRIVPSKGVVNKEKFPSMWIIGRTALIITVFFTLRIILLLLLSTLYDQFPSNFMLVVNSEDLQQHSLNLWLDVLIKSAILLSIILAFVGSFRIFNRILLSTKTREKPAK